MYNKKVLKNTQIISCKYCNYNTISNSQYNRHLLTLKHERLSNTTKLQQITTQKNTYNCECGKVYNHRASLYNHKKKCSYREEVNSEPKYTELVMKLINENKELKNTIIKQNSELQKTITDLIPKIGNNNNTNNINQKFNINVFLNEQCKDALTMEQFIEKIEVTMSNLFLTKAKGIDEGISNIFIENMQKLSLHERPMHCTDTKRETVYIKSDGDNGDNGQWSKDTDNLMLKGAIKKVEYKQHKNIKTWMEEHPGWEEDSSLQEEYLDLMRSCTKDVKEQKVIKKLCNTVKIE